MSENVTHVAVCDDVVRLASRLDAVPDPFKVVLRDHLDLARLGAATRSADKWSAEIVAWARDHWAPAAGGAGAPAGDELGYRKETGSRVAQKLVYVLGALTHRAADRLFKPVFQYCREQYGEEAGLDCSIHCDILVFREVFGAVAGGDSPVVQGSGLPTARVNPYQAAVFQGPETPRGRDLEALFRVLWQRALISMHTFSPDSGDMLGWLDRLLDAVPPFYLDLAHYQRVLEGGFETERFRRYVYDTRCYDAADALILLARRLQRGEAVDAADVTGALAATNEGASRYARALQKGLGYLLAAGEVWRREIDAGEARRRFDVGVPERSLTFVPATAPA